MTRASFSAARGALAVAVAIATASSMASVARAEPRMVALDRASALGSMRAGDEITISGSVRTAVDGTVIDALAQRNDTAGVPPHLGGLFDAAAGGLRVVEQHPDTHVYKLESTGELGPACVAAGLTSPCLATRTPLLAHERLITVAELTRSLTGSVLVELSIAPAPPAPVVTPATQRGLLGVGLAAGAMILSGVAWRGARTRRRSALGQVRKAAREALRATKGDPTLATVRDQIEGLVTRACALDEARRVCFARLSKIDHRALDAKRASWARSQAPEAGEALTWLTAEAAEAARLRADLSSSIVGLERIASALRVMALRAREHRGTTARAAVGDPVDALASELDLRDAAIAEAERATAHL